MEKDKRKNIIIILLGVIIVLLVVGLSLFIVKDKFLEDNYEKLEDRYEYLFENSLNNKENTTNNDDNSSNDNTQNNKTISRDEALDIVLKELNLKKNNLRDLDIELEYKVRYGKSVYEISFDYDYLEYEYYLDPESGKILDSFKSLS